MKIKELPSYCDYDIEIKFDENTEKSFQDIMEEVLLLLIQRNVKNY